MAKNISIPGNIEKKAVEYIRSMLKNGTSAYAIKRELLEKNYSSETADMLIQKAKRRMFALPLPAIIILIIAGIAIAAYFLAPSISPLISQIGNLFISEKNCGSDSNCFLTAANSCQPATFQNTIAGSVFQYKTASDCILTKTIFKMNETEPQEVKTALEGKSMTCEYDPNSFNDYLINTISVGTEICVGDLKDTIDEIINL